MRPGRHFIPVFTQRLQVSRLVSVQCTTICSSHPQSQIFVPQQIPIQSNTCIKPIGFHIQCCFKKRYLETKCVVRYDVSHPFVFSITPFCKIMFSYFFIVFWFGHVGFDICPYSGLHHISLKTENKCRSSHTQRTRRQSTVSNRNHDSTYHLLIISHIVIGLYDFKILTYNLLVDIVMLNR